jgi:peptidoglycan LD-endopeptidase CwlK
MPGDAYTSQSMDEALQRHAVPSEVRENLALVDVPYLSFSNTLCEGQLIVHKELAKDVRELFETLVQMKFPIEKIEPLSTYDWDDEASMIDNNTSAFNYRLILETNRLSNHSLGRAIDINPVQNPYRSRSGKIYPPNATYVADAPGTITQEGDVVALFKSRGWEWGGEWIEVTDYQHFQKL